MPDEMSQTERSARQFLADTRSLAPEIAKHMTPAEGSSKVSRKTERETYWTWSSKPEDQDPNQVWAEEIARAGLARVPAETTLDEAKYLAQPHVSMRLFPHRQKLIQSGERTMDVKAQIAYDKRMAAAGPPEGMGGNV